MVCTSIAAFDFARKLCDEYDRRKQAHKNDLCIALRKIVIVLICQEEKEMNLRKEEKQTKTNNAEGGVSPSLSLSNTAVKFSTMHGLKRELCYCIDAFVKVAK